MLLRATPNKNCALFSGACVRVSERAVRAWHGLSLSLSPVAYTRTAGGRKQSERITCSAPENGEASSRAAESGGWRLLRVGDVLECFQVRAGETDQTSRQLPKKSGEASSLTAHALYQTPAESPVSLSLSLYNTINAIADLNILWEFTKYKYKSYILFL